MAKIHCDVHEVDLDGDYGTVQGISVTCSRCGHYVEVYGTSDASYARAGVTLKEECPRRENNFYVVE